MSRAAATALTSLWPDLPAEPALAAGRRFRADPEGHFRAFTRGEIEFAAMRTLRIEATARHLGRTLPDGAHERFQASYEPAFEEHLGVHPDAHDLLTGIAGRRPYGALTNSGGDYTDRKLAVAGLAGLLPVVVTRDTLGFGKPDPRVFHHACEAIGSPPSATVHVGDEYDVDAVAAQEAGLAAVWLSRDDPDPGHAEDARARGIAVVRGLDELVPLLGLA